MFGELGMRCPLYLAVLRLIKKSNRKLGVLSGSAEWKLNWIVFPCLSGCIKQESNQPGSGRERCDVVRANLQFLGRQKCRNYVV